MAKRLTDKEKKKIIAYYVESQSYRETSRKFNVSATTVKSLVGKDTETVQKCTQKREDNTKTVLEEMEKRKSTKIKLLDKILEAMDKKCDNIDMFTNIKDLATAYGIITDKELRLEELKVRKAELELKKQDEDEFEDMDEIRNEVFGDEENQNT